MPSKIYFILLLSLITVVLVFLAKFQFSSSSSTSTTSSSSSKTENEVALQESKSSSTSTSSPPTFSYVKPTEIMKEEVLDQQQPQDFFYTDAELFTPRTLKLIYEQAIQLASASSSSKINEKELREKVDVLEIRLKSSTKTSARVSSRHSLIIPVPSLERFKQGAENLMKVMNCSKSFSKGMYWNTEANRCVKLSYFDNDLKTIASRSELVCPVDHEKKEENYATTQNEDPKNYKKFKAASSWFFQSSSLRKKSSSWMPKTSQSNQDGTSFKSYHDPKKEHLFRLENFCVSPFSNLKGYFDGGNRKNNSKHRPSKYQGLDDTRNIFHGDLSFARYLSNVEMKQKPPKFFDERPVYFIPLTKISMNNLGHLSLKMLSAIGNLKVMFGEEIFSSFSSSSSSEQQEKKPLVIFVLDTLVDNLQELEKYHPAWKMMFNILKLPFVQIITPKHSFSFSSGSSINNNNEAGEMDVLKSEDSEEMEVCFKHGFAYQNDFPLTRNQNESHQDETAISYAFRIFDRISAKRRELMDSQTKLFEECLGFSGKKKENTNELPKIFFAIRTQNRGILKLATMLDQIRKELIENEETKLVSEIVFFEPWKSDRIEYLRHLQSSDIHFGTHGATFAETWAMKKNSSILVELTERYHEQHCFARNFENNNNGNKNDKKRTSCWFGLFSEYLNGDHWVLDVPAKNVENSRWNGKNPFPVNLATLVGILRKASCRWQFKKYFKLESGEDDDENGDKIPISQSMINEFFSSVSPKCKNFIKSNLIKKSRFTGPLPVETSLLRKKIYSSSMKKSSSSSSSFGGSLTLQNSLKGLISETTFSTIADKIASSSESGIDLRRIFNDPDPQVVRETIQHGMDIKLEAATPSLWQPFVEYFVNENVGVQQQQMQENTSAARVKVCCVREVTVGEASDGSNKKEECLYLLTGK